MHSDLKQLRPGSIFNDHVRSFTLCPIRRVPCHLRSPCMDHARTLIFKSLKQAAPGSELRSARSPTQKCTGCTQHFLTIEVMGIFSGFQVPALFPHQSHYSVLHLQLQHVESLASIIIFRTCRSAMSSDVPNQHIQPRPNVTSRNLLVQITNVSLASCFYRRPTSLSDTKDIDVIVHDRYVVHTLSSL